MFFLVLVARPGLNTFLDVHRKVGVLAEIVQDRVILAPGELDPGLETAAEQARCRCWC